ncbi:MAG: hypothetical protein ACYC57_03250 [Thermoleophilia bacterium]
MDTSPRLSLFVECKKGGLKRPPLTLRSIWNAILYQTKAIINGFFLSLFPADAYHWFFSISRPLVSGRKVVCCTAGDTFWAVNQPQEERQAEACDYL